MADLNRWAKLPVRASKSSLEIEVAIRHELSALGLQAESITARAERVDDWSATIRIAERTFEIGCEAREGFFCWESTSGKKKNFIYSDCGRIAGNQNQLRRRALETIRFAIDHPECEGATYPVV